VKIEVQKLTGKELEEEQLILLANKQGIEKSITDLESLKIQFEEVAKQLEVDCEIIIQYVIYSSFILFPGRRGKKDFDTTD